MTILYVYGTLMKENEQAELVDIPGLMYDMGWFPAAVSIGNCDKTFKAQRIVVTDKHIEQFDRYEGFNKDNPEQSFYRRIPYDDGFIYQFNKKVPDDANLVEGGNWKQYVKQKRGG